MTLEGKVGAEIGGINLLIVNFSGHPHNCSNLLERIAVAIFTHKRISAFLPSSPWEMGRTM